MTKLDRELAKIVDEVYFTFVMRNLRLKKVICLCGCGKKFKPRTKYHHFYSRKCYSKVHRLKGFVKRIVNHED